MENQSQAETIPGMLVSTPTTDQKLQIGPLVEQLNLYWSDCRSLRWHVQALQTELGRIQRENIRLQGDYNKERHRHAQTHGEVLKLYEQFQRLSGMLSGEGGSAQSVLSIFFELEARSLSLQHAESELCQWVAVLRATCQRIEERYSNSLRRQQNCPTPPTHQQPYQPWQYGPTDTTRPGPTETSRAD
ncbi:hypothetical protein KXX35_009585 [Aspergillus fumigatus]|nr:hypothetical protein KXX35_009585 [Aspergillus fumigatus]